MIRKEEVRSRARARATSRTHTTRRTASPVYLCSSPLPPVSPTPPKSREVFYLLGKPVNPVMAGPIRSLLCEAGDGGMARELIGIWYDKKRAGPQEDVQNLEYEIGERWGDSGHRMKCLALHWQHCVCVFYFVTSGEMLPRMLRRKPRKQSKLNFQERGK